MKINFSPSSLFFNCSTMSPPVSNPVTVILGPKNVFSISYNSVQKNECYLLSNDADTFMVNEISYTSSHNNKIFLELQESQEMMYYSDNNHITLAILEVDNDYPGMDGTKVYKMMPHNYFMLTKGDKSIFLVVPIDCINRPTLVYYTEEYEEGKYTNKIYDSFIEIISHYDVRVEFTDDIFSFIDNDSNYYTFI